LSRRGLRVVARRRRSTPRVGRRRPSTSSGSRRTRRSRSGRAASTSTTSTRSSSPSRLRAARSIAAGSTRPGATSSWPLPAERPALAQGKVAGVPAKLLLDGDGALLVVQTAYADDLEARSG
jgi:hypothetical protein